MKKPLDIINPEAIYSAVFLGSANNMDGSRDFVLRLTGQEMKALVQLIERAVEKG